MSSQIRNIYLRRFLDMKNTYPIVLIPDEVGYVVYVPDFDINTEGDNLTEAIEMARDAIGIIGIDYEDDKKLLPVPTEFSKVEHKANEIVTLVDVDFTEYRKKNDTRTVRRNVTLPAYLDYAASQSGINVSALLQSALKQKLNLA